MSSPISADPSKTAQRKAAAVAYLTRFKARTLWPVPESAPSVDLPEISGQIRFTDEHGHIVTAYRRGRSSWVLDHTSHSGGEVLRFFSTRQLVDELNRRQEIAVEVTGGLAA